MASGYCTIQNSYITSKCIKRKSTEVKKIIEKYVTVVGNF